MFWKFTLLTSHIETLLEKEDVTLQELMDEDDLLQECKAQNRKLLDMLVRPDVMEELVNFITQEPGEDTDEKVRYKYPHTACELLTSDVSLINDTLAGEEALLNKIYTFLENEGPLNSLLASFFSKVMGLLIARKSEIMVEFLQAKDDFVGSLLSHLGTSAIMDLLLRLITCIECPEVRLNVITVVKPSFFQWLNEKKLVPRLIALLDSSVQEEKHCNASQAICDMIKLSRERNVQMQDEADPDPLLETLESPDTVSDMLNHMFDHKVCESVLVNGLGILQTLLEFKRPVAMFSSFEGSQEQMTPLDEERLQQGINNTLLALVPRLKDIHNLLLEPPKQHYNAMPTTLGSLDPPLGNTRLQTSRLIATIVATNSSNVVLELVNLGTIKVLLNLFYEYSWNNFLHTQVVHLISSILNNSSIEIDGEEKHPLLQELICECKLIEKILDSWEDNEQIQSRPGGHRRGFMGHLTRIANEIVQVTERGNNVERFKELLKEIPEDYREKWESFVSGTLADINKKNTVDLELPCGPDLLARVGAHQLPSSSEDDDNDFSNIPFPQDTAMQQAFSDYQLQQMTSNFIDQFGFNEEEFAEQNEHVDSQFNDKISSIDFSITTNEEPPNAAMFEQACSQRIQRFDDPERDSDEDVWEEKEITYSHGMDAPKAVIPRPRAGGSSDEDSSDEEDLNSPAVIRQAPSSTEKMDVDSTQEWNANFNDINMEPTPVAMDTAPTAWENPTSSTPETGWASFGEEENREKGGKDEEWADFTSFLSMEASASNSNQPRSSSPDKMDVGESTSSRTAAYVVPNEDSKNVESSSEAAEAVANPPSSTDEPVTPKSPAASDVMTVEADSTSSPVPANGTPVSPDTCASSEGETNPDNLTFNPDLALDDAEDEEDLSDNFNFLASSGLMKVISPNKVETQVHGNGPTAPDSSIDSESNSSKLESKESCSPADSATSPGVTLNGPV